MAVFTSSVFALRKKMIIQALRDAGAVGPDSESPGRNESG